MRLKMILTTLILVLFGLIPANAQEAIVHGVFFYSPTCPHCHEVMTNDWPGIQETFGDQLVVLFVDARTQGGNAIMQEARDVMNIASNGVPMLIIGDTVLVGSIDIPKQTPNLVRDGLANGGIDLPPIPSLIAAYEQALASESPTVEPTLPVVEQSVTQPTLLDKLSADPIANGAAVVVLLALIGSLLLIVGRRVTITWARLPLIALGSAGFIMGGSLLWGSLGETPIALLAAGLMLVFLLLIISSARSANSAPDWLIPLVALAGLAVAAYLAYVEMTLSDAVCGAVGNCNTVQQSDYARIFGVPIGVIGLFGYSLIVLVWAYSRFVSDKQANSVIWLLSLVGVIFSVYLTFLEPFVIGATCLWCLSSAVMILALLWLASSQVDFLQQKQSAG